MAELYQGKFSGEEIDSAIEKIEAIQGLPTGGTTGQVVTKTDNGVEWATGLILENEWKVSSSIGDGPSWDAVIRIYKQSNTIYPYKIMSITPFSVGSFSYGNEDFTDFGTRKIAVKQSQEVVLPEEVRKLGIAWQNDVQIGSTNEGVTRIFEITTIGTSSVYNNLILKLYAIADTPASNSGIQWTNTTYWFRLG